jgi:hypothetical protein
MTIPPVLACAVGLALPALAASAWLRRVLPSAPFTLRFPLAFALGLGTGALSYVAWRACGLRHGAAYVAFDAAVFSLLAIAGFRRGAPPKPFKAERAAARPTVIRSAYATALAVAVASAVAATAAAGILLRLSNHPPGAWDAWAMWNTRARFLALAFPPEQAFGVSPALHPEYPLLLPGSVARLFGYAGRVTPAAPASIAFACTLATAALLWGGLRARPIAAAAAVALLLGTEGWLLWGTSMYADVPLAMFVLAAVIALDLADATAEPGRRAAAVAAGLSAGLACWTKNEGLLALAILLAARTVLAPPGRDDWWSRTALRPFLAGVAAPLFATLLYKALQPAPDALLASQGASALRMLSDPERLSIVAAAFARALWALGGGAIAVAATCSVLLGWRPSRGGLWTVSVPLGMIAGFAVVFLVTPHDLNWHLRTALDRLLLQCWPLLLYALFRSGRSPAIAGHQKTSTCTSPPPPD